MQRAARRRPTHPGAAVLGAACATAAALLAAAPGAHASPGVPLPTPAVPLATPGVPLAQPGAPLAPPELPPTSNPPGTCSPASGSPGTWRHVTGAEADTPPAPPSFNTAAAMQYPAPGFQVTVDPQVPCRMYRSRDTHTVERSLDGGGTWSAVLSDTEAGSMVPDPGCLLGACAISTPFAISGISVADRGVPGLLALGEAGNGDAVVVSTDGGTTWNVASGAAFPVGVAGEQVTRVSVARSGDPSQPFRAYAASQQPGAGGLSSGNPKQLSATFTGGQSWAPSVPQPVGDILALNADNAAPDQAWMIATTLLQGIQHLYRTTDGGLTWSDQGATPGGGVYVDSNGADLTATQLATYVAPDGRERVFTLGGGQQVGVAALHTAEYSDDIGATWSAVPLPLGVSAAAIAFSPTGWGAIAGIEPHADGTESRVRLFVSRDGFHTMAETAMPSLPAWAAAALTTPLAPPGGSTTADPGSVLQADAYGNFYLAVSGCLDETTQVQSGDVFASCSRHTEDYWQFTPDPNTASAPAPPAGAPPGELLNQFATCPLGLADSSSSPLAFDGVDLIYPDPDTNYNDGRPLDNRPAYTDYLHVIDPNNCTLVPPRVVTVHFKPEDTQRACATDYGCSTPSQPRIDELTYDPSRRLLWFALANGNGIGSVLFTVPYSQSVSDVTASLAWPANPNGCGQTLTYDRYDDSLWTCDLGPGQFPGSAQQKGMHLRAVDGASMRSCTFYETATGPAWAAGLPGHMFVWNEDDITIGEISDTACGDQYATYTHRPIVEPVSEDEQLVCDAVSFTAARGFNGGDTTVFWLRDSAANDVVAFATTGGRCPMATHIAITVTPACPGLVQLSAAVTLAGSGVPLAGLPVQFTLDGAPTGQPAITGADGVAHQVGFTSMGAGTHALGAQFAGNTRLDMSQTSAAVTVRPPLGCTTPTAGNSAPIEAQRPGTSPPRGAAILGLSGNGPPVEQPTGQFNPAVQAQAQAQSQSQGQAQATAQLQPGVMVQRQPQRQVATQITMLAPGQHRTADALLSSRREAYGGGGAAIRAVTAVGLMLGLGLAARPARALALAGRRRSRNRLG
jgi:hypothetical protein